MTELSSWEVDLEAEFDRYKKDRAALAKDAASITLNSAEQNQVIEMSSEMLLERVGTEGEKVSLKGLKVSGPMRLVLVERYLGILKVRKFFSILHASYRIPEDKFYG